MRKTRLVCKECRQIFIRSYDDYGFNIVFIPSCEYHEGWKSVDLPPPSDESQSIEILRR